MDLKKVYDATIDPLDYAGTVNLIINNYFASKDDEDYFGRLRDTESEFLECFAFSIDEIDRFTSAHNAMHCILFNNWMNDIRRISRLSVNEKNEFLERVSRASQDMPTRVTGYQKLDFEKTKTAFNRLAHRVNKTTMSATQAIQIDTFKESFSDPNVQRLLELLNWFSGEQSEDKSDEKIKDDILHIKANYLLKGQRKDARNSVFLAFVPNKLNVIEFVNEYLKRCDEFGVPYDIDIPYDQYTKRLVKINSTIANLGKNLAIIEDIAEKNPEMIKKMSEPPVLCGRIKKWIGIGTYSGKEIERTPYGFTEKRTKVIVDAIEETTKDYILDNRNQPLKANGITATLKRHLSGYTYDTYVRKITELTDQYYQEIIRDHTPEEAEDAVEQYFGFKRKDLDNAKYLKKISKNIDIHVSRMIFEEFNEDYNLIPVPSPKFLMPSNRSINLKGLFPEVLKKIAMDITAVDPRFKGYIVKAIRERYEEIGIDKNSCYEDYIADQLNYEEVQDFPDDGESSIKEVEKLMAQKKATSKKDIEDR